MEQYIDLIAAVCGVIIVLALLIIIVIFASWQHSQQKATQKRLDRNEDILSGHTREKIKTDTAQQRSVTAKNNLAALKTEATVHQTETTNEAKKQAFIDSQLSTVQKEMLLANERDKVADAEIARTLKLRGAGINPNQVKLGIGAKLALSFLAFVFLTLLALSIMNEFNLFN